MADGIANGWLRLGVINANPSAGDPPGCPVRRWVSVGWLVLIQDSEDRVIGCYPLAVREGRCGAEADVWSSPQSDTDVFLDSGRSTFNGAPLLVDKV